MSYRYAGQSGMTRNRLQRNALRKSATIRTMDASRPSDDFYASLPVFRDFTQVTDDGAASSRCRTAGWWAWPTWCNRPRRLPAEPLQGREHGGRRGDRGDHQRADGPRLPLRVRRRRRELRGVGRGCRRWRGRRWPKPRPGSRKTSISPCASAWCRSPTSARTGTTCASPAIAPSTNVTSRISGGGLLCRRRHEARLHRVRRQRRPHADLNGCPAARADSVAARQVLSLVVTPGPRASPTISAHVVEAITASSRRRRKRRGHSRPGAAAEMAAAGRRSRSARLAPRRRIDRARKVKVLALTFLFPRHAKRPRWAVHPGEIRARAGREFRFPQVRRSLRMVSTARRSWRPRSRIISKLRRPTAWCATAPTGRRRR